MELKKLEGMEDFSSTQPINYQGQELDKQKLDIIQKLGIGSHEVTLNS